MTPQVVTASPDTTLADALSLVRSHRIRHLPVLEQGRLVGIVTDRDLRLAMPPAAPADAGDTTTALSMRRVAEVMTPNVVTITADTPMEEAARQLCTNRIGCLPVMDGPELVGILTDNDVMRAFAELFSSSAQTRRVEAEMPNAPGELARVVHLIGSELRINIAGMVVPQLEDGTRCLAVMHLQVPDASRVVHALRRLGYRAGAPSIATDPDAEPEPEREPVAAGAGRLRALVEL
jgi:acetoin utilization protein AcuB